MGISSDGGGRGFAASEPIDRHATIPNGSTMHCGEVASTKAPSGAGSPGCLQGSPARQDSRTRARRFAGGITSARAWAVAKPSEKEMARKLGETGGAFRAMARQAPDGRLRVRPGPIMPRARWLHPHWSCLSKPRVHSQAPSRRLAPVSARDGPSRPVAIARAGAVRALSARVILIRHSPPVDVRMTGGSAIDPPDHPHPPRRNTARQTLRRLPDAPPRCAREA